VEAVMKAAEELQGSKKLYKLFEYILAVGNYLNGGSNRGGAYGFRVDTLLKLKDTRSNNPMIPSLMHYIVDLVESKQSELLEFHKDLAHVEHAAKVNTPVVLSQIATLRKGLEDLEREATVAPISNEVDTFKNVMNAFLISAKADFKEVDDKVLRMDEAFKVVAKLYGEPNAKPEELFNIFSNFVDTFVKAKEENVKKREAAIKAAAKKKAAEEAAAIKAQMKKDGVSTKGKIPVATEEVLDKKVEAGVEGLEELETLVVAAKPAAGGPQEKDEERGGMDNMLAALRSGSAFRRAQAV